MTVSKGKGIPTWSYSMNSVGETLRTTLDETKLSIKRATDCFNLSFFTAGDNYWAGTGGVRYTRQGENSIWTPWKNMSADSLIAPGALGYRTEKSFPSGTVESALDVYIDARGYFKNFADARLQVDGRWVRNKNNTVTSSAEFDPRISLTVSIHYCNLFVPLPK